jgi:hypothetical protein
MASNPTVSELRKTSDVTDEEITTAVDTYLSGSKAGPHRFASGYVMNVADAVQAYVPAKAAVNHPDRSAKFKRNMVRTAILLAHPVKG